MPVQTHTPTFLKSCALVTSGSNSEKEDEIISERDEEQKQVPQKVLLHGTDDEEDHCTTVISLSSDNDQDDEDLLKVDAPKGGIKKKISCAALIVIVVAILVTTLVAFDNDGSSTSSTSSSAEDDSSRGEESFSNEKYARAESCIEGMGLEFTSGTFMELGHDNHHDHISTAALSGKEAMIGVVTYYDESREESVATVEVDTNDGTELSNAIKCIEEDFLESPHYNVNDIPNEATPSEHNGDRDLSIEQVDCSSIVYGFHYRLVEKRWHSYNACRSCKAICSNGRNAAASSMKAYFENKYSGCKYHCYVYEWDWENYKCNSGCDGFFGQGGCYSDCDTRCFYRAKCWNL